MKTVQLTKNKVAFVDDEDYKKISLYTWRWESGRMLYGYAATGHKALMLHNLIMSPPIGYEVDHIDGNGLNNVRSNLRIATRAQQCQNRNRSSYHSSNFKGVRWWKHKKIWQTRIKKEGKSTHLGYFKDEKLAAEAYDEAARRLFGIHAKTNF